MENVKEEKDTLENAIKFIDSVTKTLEGLKDKFSGAMFDGELKNDKPEPILHNWVNQTNQIMKDKFEEVYEVKYSEENFRMMLKNWLVKFKDNIDFVLNAKVLFKNLQYIRNTIKTKITSSDSLSYINLTDMLVNKSKMSGK